MAPQEKKSRLELRDFLGRTALVVASDPKLVEVYMPGNKKVILDRHDGREYLRRWMGVQVAWFDWLQMLTGSIPLVWMRTQPKRTQWNEDHALYEAEWTRGNETFLVQIDPHNFSLHQIQVKVEGHTTHITFRDKRLWCNTPSRHQPPLCVQLGSVIEMENESGTKLVWEWDKVEQKPLQNPSLIHAFPPGTHIENAP